MGTAGLMRDVNYPPLQFALFRISFGVFLATHFAWLLPYADEIYGLTGMFPPSLASRFPNLLFHVPAAPLVGALVLLSLLFCLGIQRRAAAIALWYGWACLTNRNPLLSIPSEGIVGWMLLASALIPTGEPWALLRRPRPSWRMPTLLHGGAWLVVGLGYSVSGYDKLGSWSWVEGDALRLVLESPMVSAPLLAEALLALPDLLLRLGTWLVLMMELLSLPLSIFAATRKWIWLLMLLMQLAIRVLLDLHTVTDPFLLAHLLLLPVHSGKRLRSSLGCVVS